MQQYVIIGNGVAAVGCIEGIKSCDKESKITVISGENHFVYGRPLISYYLESKTDLEKMKYRPDDFYQNNGCEVLYGKKAIKIDAQKHLVLLNDGTDIPFTCLCIAAGSSPFVPSFEGLETVENKFFFMTIDDTLSIEKVIKKDAKVLIVGAGLIGLKCAEGLRDRVGQITVCDLSDRVLSSILDEECAAMMQKHLEENQIKFMLGDTAMSFDKNTAFMKSGTEVLFDILVLAVGVLPNTSLFKEIGGNVNRGIVVNNRMETSAIDIFSAGDCTEGLDISCEQNRILAILPNAYMQGKCAGINMAGGNEVFDKAIPMSSIGFFGLHAMTAGSYFSTDQGGEVYEEKSNDKIKRLYSRDGYLTGFILIGDIERAGIYTSLIREKVPLNTINYEMIQKSPTLAPFSTQYCIKKLGGVI